MNKFFARALRRVLPTLALFALALAVSGLAQNASVSAKSAPPAPSTSVLTQAAYHTYTLTITRDGQTISGTLVVSGKDIQYAADDATFTAPRSEYKTFFNLSDAVLSYYDRFAVNGQYISSVFVFAGSVNYPSDPNGVRIVIGIPVPGSLSGGAGLITLDGALQSDGSLSNYPGDTVIWTAR